MNSTSIVRPFLIQQTLSNGAINRFGRSVRKSLPFALIWAKGTKKISFKCSDMNYEILYEWTNILPAPYLARAKWVQLVTRDAIADDDIMLYIQLAHGIIVGKLTKALRKELNL